MGLGNDLVSNSKIYIDFGAGVGATGAGGGGFLLTKVNTLDETDDSDAEGKSAMGVRGYAGITYKDGAGGTLSLEVFREQGIPEVDYRKLKFYKVKHTYTVADEGGQIWQYQGCVVANVARKDDSQGSHMDTVKVIYARRTPMS